MKVNVYIDGFNLYYGAVKGTPYRWLNLAEMCRLPLPRDQILQIKYFAALVNPRHRAWQKALLDDSANISLTLQ